jgi:hypothetical protein
LGHLLIAPRQRWSVMICKLLGALGAVRAVPAPAASQPGPSSPIPAWLPKRARGPSFDIEIRRRSRRSLLERHLGCRYREVSDLDDAELGG